MADGGCGHGAGTHYPGEGDERCSGQEYDEFVGHKSCNYNTNCREFAMPGRGERFLDKHIYKAILLLSVLFKQCFIFPHLFLRCEGAF